MPTGEKIIPGITKGVTATTTSTIPSMVIIDRAKIDQINNKKFIEQSIAYQSGAADALDWIRDLLGIKKAQYRSAPSSQVYTRTICFREDYGYSDINASLYSIRLCRNNTIGDTLCQDLDQNITYLRIQPKTISKLNIK